MYSTCIYLTNAHLKRPFDINLSTTQVRRLTSKLWNVILLFQAPVLGPGFGRWGRRGSIPVRSPGHKDHPPVDSSPDGDKRRLSCHLAGQGDFVTMQTPTFWTADVWKTQEHWHGVYMELFHLIWNWGEISILSI